MTDHRTPSDRRAFLRAIGGGLAVGGTAATAGCFGTLPPLGGDIDFGRVDPPAPADPTYRQSIPDPVAFEGVTERDVHDRYPRIIRPGAFPGGPSGSTVHANYAGVTKLHLDHFGIGWESYRAVVDYFDRGADPNVLLIDAPLDPDAVEATLVDSGYERVDGTGDARTFERTDPSRTVAVLQSTVVFATGARARSDVRTVLDAVHGRVQRYHEVDETFARLSDRVGANALTTFHESPVYTVDDPEIRRRARAVRPVSNAVYTVDVLAFPADATPTTQGLERAYASRAAEDGVSMEVSVEGGLGVVERRVPREAFLKARQKRDGGAITWPQVTWSATFDRAAETVTFTHRGGESVEAENTEAILYQDGLDDKFDAQFWADTDRITRGDSLTVDVSDRAPDDVAALVYYIYGVSGRNVVDLQFGGEP
jgi:hypothetical protein